MELTPELLLLAYARGIFPMAGDDGTISWCEPEPRAILPLESFHLPRRLARTVRQRPFDLHVNRAFAAVISACAAPAAGREQTWISDELIAAYVALHQAGFAHSVEAWQNGRLVGGLYGVALRGLFAGESMFSRTPDASKVALVYLVDRLRRRGYQLLDIQFMSPHMARFGAVAIPRRAYRARLQAALAVDARFDDGPTPARHR